MSIKNTLLPFFIVLITFLLLKAWLPQNISKIYEADEHYCASDEMMQKAFEKDPGLEKRHWEIEEAIHKDRLEQGNEKLASPPPYIIPVVVHIIHENGPENITDAQVLDGIDHLNEAFANVNYYDQGTGVNTQIQFCLAKRTPEGTFTTGINRVVSPLTNVDMNSEDLDLKNLIRWDPLHYVNFWLVGEICSGSSGCGVAGYAYLPSAHGSSVDGIVQEARWFGSSNANSGVQIHEMGHYLGLYHTFQGGCTNDDCMTDGDRVCDTPPDNSTVAVPCAGSANSCSTDTNSGFATDQNDMFWDYMDYGNWSCYSAFTQGQTDRMHWFIENVRESLLESEACNDPCSVNLVAGFSPNVNQTVDIGTTINFVNTTSNGSLYDWHLDGVSTTATTDFSYTFNSLGTFVVTLYATNADPNCHDEYAVSVTVVCPVEAAFSSSNVFPLPGEIVAFTNASVNASGYTWIINGIVQANTDDLTYVFPSNGIYNICLEASDGLCTDSFCQTLFVFEPSGTCEDSTFVKTIGQPGINEEGTVIIPSGDGNFYIGAAYYGQPYLLKMTPGGVMLWQYYIPIGSDNVVNVIITDMIVDSEGMLVVCGFGGGIQTSEGFAFKYDPVLHSLLWMTRLAPASAALSILEPVSVTTVLNHYLLFAETHYNPAPGNPDDFTYMKLDRNTGSTAIFTPLNFSLGTSQTSAEAAIYNNEIYSIGRYTHPVGTNSEKMRFGLTKMDMAGNEIWSKLYHIPINQNARLYPRDFIIENQSIYMAGDGDDAGSSLTAIDPFLVKTDLQGNLQWVRKIQLFGIGKVNVQEMVSTPNSFFITGRTVEAPYVFYVMKTNKEGMVQWAKSYSFSGNDFFQPLPLNQMIVDGQFLYLTAKTSQPGGTDSDILLVKMDLDGNTAGECVSSELLGVEDYYIQQPIATNVDLIEYDSPIEDYPYEGPVFELQSPEDGCGCQQDTLPCETTFVKTMGTATDNETGRLIITEPGGGFIAGATKGDSTLLVLMDGEGVMIWERSFKFTNQGEHLADLRLDSDNNLIAVGGTDLIANNRECFAFKYDYQNDVLLWSKILDFSNQSTSVFATILELGPGANYIIGGGTAQNSSPGLGCDAFLMEITRDSGNPVWYQNYNLGSCEGLAKVILHANSLYGTGRYNYAGGGTDKMRQAVSQFDLSGNEIWSRLYLVNVQNNARLYSTDMISDNGLIVIGHGDVDGTSATDISMQMFKTDYSGNVEWTKNYQIPGAVNQRLIRLLNLPDGYLLLGNFEEGPVTKMFLAKTNKVGEIQWSKKYGGNQNDYGYDVIWNNGLIYLIGKSESYGLGGPEDLFLAKLRLDGSLSGECIAISDLTINENEFVDPYDGLHPLNAYQPLLDFPDNSAQSQITYLEETPECFVPCQALDTCVILAEAILVGLEGVCQGDSILITLEVCNTGNGLLPEGTLITFYEGDPTATAAPVIQTGILPQNLETDSCLIFQLTMPTPVFAPVFVVVNDDGNTTTPFDLEGADFPNTEVSECNFFNNIGSFELGYIPPTLNLGPDTVMCDNATITMDAGSGFYEYRWFNGSMEQTYTSWEPGIYWVEVTDSCGGIQSDTLTITVLPETELHIAQDTMVCPGTVTLTASGFEKYQWFPQAQIDCDTCATVVVNIDSMTIIEVVGENAPGCFSVDTITINVLPPLLTQDTISVCAGDTVLIFSTPETMEGDYSQTFTAVNGCDSTHIVTLMHTIDTLVTNQLVSICQGDSTMIFGNFEYASGLFMQIDTSGSCVLVDRVELEVRDTFATAEALSICESDTILLFGQAVFTSGLYSQQYQSVLGCDSIHWVELTVLDSVMTSETVTICSNETADVFGTPTSLAGDYFMTFTGHNNCDSTHMIRLEVFPVAETEETIVLCAGDSVLVFGNYENIGGDYSQQFAAFNTCDSMHTVHLQVLSPLTVNFEIEPSCQGNNDGNVSAVVSGGQPGYTLQWNNGQTGNALQNLAPGIYELTLTDGNNCMTFAQAEVEAANAAIVSVETADLDCFGDTDGVITVLTSESNLLYSLDGINFQSGNVFNNLQAGSYSLYVQNADGCVNTYPVALIEPQELLVSLPEDMTVHLGDSIQIQPATNGVGNLVYQWLPLEGLSCANCLVPVAGPWVSTLYSLTVTDENGCRATDDIFILVEKVPRVYVPNAFSPNADGINDVFYINAGTEALEIKSFRVFDRWGNLVFEGENLKPNDPNYGWDGSFNGRPMNNAVFVYYAEIAFVDGSSEVVKGEVALLR